MDHERLIFDVVSDSDSADPNAICVTLYEEDGELMAWFIGPVTLSRRGLKVPYLPKSARRHAAAALVTAMGTALVERLNVCVVDPDRLWATV